MALFTLNPSVLTLEAISALGVVIKGHERPLLWSVALITGLIDLADVEVLMAVTARGVDRLEVALFVTAIASSGEVSASELEAATAVIKERDRPRERAFMTLGAVGARELAAVNRLRVAALTAR